MIRERRIDSDLNVAFDDICYDVETLIYRLMNELKTEFRDGWRVVSFEFEGDQVEVGVYGDDAHGPMIWFENPSFSSIPTISVAEKWLIANALMKKWTTEANR